MSATRDRVSRDVHQLSNDQATYNIGENTLQVSFRLVVTGVAYLRSLTVIIIFSWIIIILSV